MKQIVQDLKFGATVLEKVQVPRVKSGCVLLQMTRMLVLLGTDVSSVWKGEFHR